MKTFISNARTRNTFAIVFIVLFVISIIVAIYNNLDNHFANICSIISAFISIYFYFYKNKPSNTSINTDYGIKHTVDFKELYEFVREHKQRRYEIEVKLQEIEKYFQIDIYEIQIEVKHSKEGERTLSTICSSYEDPRNTSVRKENGDYSCQTAYAFDKNKSMWITAGGRKLKGGIGYYVDEWSNTKSKEIPEFWNPDQISNEICTSVIIPLRFPHMETDFGFIDFESTKYHPIQNNINAIKTEKLFQEITKIFVKEYIEKKLTEDDKI
ncbi:MAG: hypothetical protein FWD60_04495 [Candidatus Azobacteroides sp.]|nr:hypothetical protein [Candidatus Azobacteroides sp.]